MAPMPKMVGGKFPWHAALPAFSIYNSLAGPASLSCEKYMYAHTHTHTHTHTHIYIYIYIYIYLLHVEKSSLKTIDTLKLQNPNNYNIIIVYKEPSRCNFGSIVY